MKYQVTCVTPTLVGDGDKLAPIDYMVWKDHVNILDQTRIFKLLAKGPRLEGYLAQLKRATKLDFASWGGFAQNFAGRRIPFENAAYAAEWNRTEPEYCSIPTFTAGASGSYLPGTAIKGALRTAMLAAAWKDGMLADLPSRRPGETAEQRTVGSRTRAFMTSDSKTVPDSIFRIYMVKTATMQGAGKQLGWKPVPVFAEMAIPGSVFEGSWHEREFLAQDEVWRMLRWGHAVSRKRVFSAANDYAAKQIDVHGRFAQRSGLGPLIQQVDALKVWLQHARDTGGCLLSIGWGAGFIGKSAVTDTENPDYRRILQQQTLYERAIKTGLPFPKTRRVVYVDNQPASLAGWVELQVGE
jgi:CRISPR-associated protein Csm5